MIKCRKGFTLVEILISMFMILLPIAAILALFVNCIFLTESTSNLSTALSHAQFAMENIKNLPYGSMASEIWNSANLLAKGVTPLSNESIAINVTSASPRYVTVAVTWLERGSRSRTTSIETYITQP